MERRGGKSEREAEKQRGSAYVKTAQRHSERQRNSRLVFVKQMECEGEEGREGNAE